MKKLFVYFLIILSSSFLFASITIEEAEERKGKDNMNKEISETLHYKRSIGECAIIIES